VVKNIKAIHAAEEVIKNKKEEKSKLSNQQELL
jgi:hypothetical protein